MVRRELLVALAVVVLIALSAAPAASKKKDHLGDFEVLATVVKEIEDGYAEEVDSNALFYGALRGMLSVLDPHTTFFSPNEMEDLRLGIIGKFGGLGIEISIVDGTLTVITPIEGTPAFIAGVAAGDKIIKINGESTKNVTLREAVNTLRGDPGTEVTITVLHQWAKTQGDAEDITIRRARIKVPSVRGFERDDANNWKYMIDDENKIGYVRLIRFQENSPAAVREAARRLMGRDMRAMVFDLRFNAGGVLPAAVEIADLFIRKGVIVETRGRVPKENIPFHAKVYGTLPDFPVVVLINGWSASASEIVAGALQDHKRATIVGERSFGKGSVQRVKSIREIMERRRSRSGGGRTNRSDFLDCGLKITTARYYTPNGRTFDRAHANVSDRMARELVKGLRKDKDGSKSAREAEAEKMRGGIIPDVEVVFTDEERRQLAESWRNIAIIHSPKEGEKEEKKEEKKEGEDEQKEFVDKQLKEALKILREKLASG